MVDSIWRRTREEILDGLHAEDSYDVKMAVKRLHAVDSRWSLLSEKFIEDAETYGELLSKSWDAKFDPPGTFMGWRIVKALGSAKFYAWNGKSGPHGLKVYIGESTASRLLDGSHLTIKERVKLWRVIASAVLRYHKDYPELGEPRDLLIPAPLDTESLPTMAEKKIKKDFTPRVEASDPDAPLDDMSAGTPFTPPYAKTSFRRDKLDKFSDTPSFHASEVRPFPSLAMGLEATGIPSLTMGLEATGIKDGEFGLGPEFIQLMKRYLDHNAMPDYGGNIELLHSLDPFLDQVHLFFPMSVAIAYIPKGDPFSVPMSGHSRMALPDTEPVMVASWMFVQVKRADPMYLVSMPNGEPLEYVRLRDDADSSEIRNKILRVIGNAVLTDEDRTKAKNENERKVRLLDRYWTQQPNPYEFEELARKVSLRIMEDA